MTKDTKTRLHALNSGQEATRNLSECLAIDFATLLKTTHPHAPEHITKVLQQSAKLGITKRMHLAASLLLAEYGIAILPQFLTHPSDTLRGWGCFMIALSEADHTEKLQNMKALANDPHFGVREWAWLALRPAIILHLDESISVLSEWTNDPSENIRRFTSEATRPRGVWSTHIDELKRSPELALPILQPLRADSARYVQDSVGNWLNDAAKSQPQWVQSLCETWCQESPAKTTQRICTKALRSLQKKH